MYSPVETDPRPRDQAVVEPPRLSATSKAAQSLRRQLADGTWVAGDRLPSEPTLAKELGVSRVSVRGALAQLEAEGLLNRRHGSGTYVNTVRPLVQSLHLNVGSDALITSRGHVAGISEMSWRLEDADPGVAERLALETGTPVVHLYRVRTSDGVPVTVSHDYFAAALVPEQPLNLGPSLYTYLSTVCGVEVIFGVATLTPGLVGADHADVFGVEAAELCLVIKQVDYDVTERPVSYSVEYHLASAFDFQLVRQGPASPGAVATARNAG